MTPSADCAAIHWFRTLSKRLRRNSLSLTGDVVIPALYRLSWMEFVRERGSREPSWMNGANCIAVRRSEEHTSELQSLMRISYAVFCLKKKKCYTLCRDSNLLHINIYKRHNILKLTLPVLHNHNII